MTDTDELVIHYQYFVKQKKLNQQTQLSSHAIQIKCPYPHIENIKLIKSISEAKNGHLEKL